MYDPFSLALLAVESQKVVERRLVLMAWGGRAAQTEVHQMVSEKIDASLEAAGTLMRGGSIQTVIDRFREHVAANTDRLGQRSG